MSNPIYTNDIFDDSKINEAINQLKKLDNYIAEIETRLKSIKTTLPGFSPSKDGKQIEEAAVAVRKLANEHKNLKIEKSELGKEIEIEKEKRRQLRKEQKLQAKATLAEKDSLDGLEAKIKGIQLQLRKMGAEKAKATAEGKRLTAQSKRLSAQFRKQKAETLGTRTAFSKLATSAKRLLGIYLGFHAVQRVFDSIFRTTKQLDAVTFAIEKIITDEKELAQTQEFLSETTKAFGVDLLTATQAYTKFRAATKATSLSVKETQDIFGTFAKVSSVLGQILNPQEKCS